jgi:hypothetical protein
VVETVLDPMLTRGLPATASSLSSKPIWKKSWLASGLAPPAAVRNRTLNQSVSPAAAWNTVPSGRRTA